MAIPSLHGKRCLVTGAASGIGEAVARAAAAEGAELFLTDVAAEGLESVAASIRADGGRVRLGRALDVADLPSVEAFAHEAHALAGSMDVVMNVAGVAVWGTVETLDHAGWRRSVEVNLMGPIHVIECFVPAMIREGRGGHLVNVSSAAGLIGLPWHAPYSASKFGLRGVSEVLRFDLRRHGIGVSLVCPGAVDTALVDTVDIQGVDRDDPRLRALRAHFRRHAVTPAAAAEAILEGIRRGTYLVYTSADVRWAHRLERFAPRAYALTMRLLNDALVRATAPARRGDAGGAEAATVSVNADT